VGENIAFREGRGGWVGRGRRERKIGRIEN